MNIHKSILENYGQQALTLVRQNERKFSKLVSLRNRRIFALRCLDSGIIPVFTRIKSSLKRAAVSRIVARAERAILNSVVRKIHQEIPKTRAIICEQDAAITGSLSGSNSTVVFCLCTHLEISGKHSEKLCLLRERQED